MIHLLWIILFLMWDFLPLEGKIICILCNSLYRGQRELENNVCLCREMKEEVLLHEKFYHFRFIPGMCLFIHGTFWNIWRLQQYHYLNLYLLLSLWRNSFSFTRMLRKEKGESWINLLGPGAYVAFINLSDLLLYHLVDTLQKRYFHI